MKRILLIILVLFITGCVERDVVVYEPSFEANETMTVVSGLYDPELAAKIGTEDHPAGWKEPMYDTPAAISISIFNEFASGAVTSKLVCETFEIKGTSLELENGEAGTFSFEVPYKRGAEGDWEQCNFELTFPNETLYVGADVRRGTWE